METTIPTIKTGLVLEGHAMYHGPNPSGIDQYNFVPVIAYYHPEMPEFSNRIQGMVRGMRDAQYLYNRRKIIELDILESQVNSGIKFKENALVDPKDAFITGQGRAYAIRAEAQMTDVETIQAPNIPPSMVELSRILAEEMQKISGVNEELLGSAVDEKAGILSMLRQGAGLTTLQILFDNLDYAQKILGKRMISLIQTNFTPGKVKRILNEEPEAQFYNKAFGKYDAAVEEGINTSTQRQQQFAQLINLREIGVPIPDSAIIEAATIQKKGDLIKAMEQQQQQAQQAQQMQMQVQMQEIQARTNLANARAEADRGLGYERISRIEENRALAVERLDKGQHDKMIAIVDLIKALKEIDTVDLDNISKVITLENLMAQGEQVVRGQTLSAPQATPEQTVSTKGP